MYRVNNGGIIIRRSICRRITWGFQMKAEIHLDRVQFEEFNTYIYKLINKGLIDIKDVVLVYIDSTSLYNYMDCIKGYDKAWSWQTYEYTNSGPYYELTETLEDILKRLQVVE